MGLLNMVMGNAEEVSRESLQQDLAEIMIEGETIEQGFKVIRDMFVFTTKRFILIDKQGISGKKVEYLSIPYRSISSFSVETAGNFDLDSELKLYVRDIGLISKDLKKGIDVKGICKMFSKHVL